jgi:hypothetical protein
VLIEEDEEKEEEASPFKERRPLNCIMRYTTTSLLQQPTEFIVMQKYTSSTL